MKLHETRNTALALIGLGALTVYILACTSFSPDDTKVLYPAFDPKTGQMGIWVYDRNAARSEPVFTPVWFEDSTNKAPPLLQRPQWSPDGRRILIAWQGGDDDVLHLATVPFRQPGAVTVWALPGVEEAGTRLVYPLTVVGWRVLVADSERIHRLDLATGELVRHEGDTNIALYPSSVPGQVLYVENAEGAEGRATIGRMNPSTFARTPLMVVTNKLDDGQVALSPDATRVAHVPEQDEQTQLIVLRAGRTELTRTLNAPSEKLRVGVLLFDPGGTRLFAPFMSQEQGHTNVAYGVLEIPLNDRPPGRTILIREAPEPDDDEMAPSFFQAGLSNDRKTLAIASTYLACLKAHGPFKAQDCALFLVDLSDPGRKVKKIAIPLPAEQLPPVLQ